MKLLGVTCIAAVVAITTMSIKYVEPLFQRNGSSVLVVPGNNGVVLSVKLPEKLTQKQLRLLSFAYDVAKADGMKYPQSLQGVIMQESHAGALDNYRVAGLTNKPGDRYFGAGQIKLAAAKDVMKQYPELWQHLDTRTDEELQAQLIMNDEFNIRVASKYLLLMGINRDADLAITSYNQGAGGARLVDPSTWHYNLGVKKHISKLKKNT